MDLNGARIIVFGATGALGGMIADDLSARGAALVVSGRNVERLAATAQRTNAVSSLPANLADPAEAAGVISVGAASLGGLDGMVYAAGIVAFGAAADLPLPVLSELVNVNLSAPIVATSAALAEMGKGSVIVNLSAIVADHPTAGMAAYSATKAGLTAFDAAAAREGRRTGIRILDARPPHLSTGLENRPINGHAPKLPPGGSPQRAVAAIVEAIADDSCREISWESVH